MSVTGRLTHSQLQRRARRLDKSTRPLFDWADIAMQGLGRPPPFERPLALCHMDHPAAGLAAALRDLPGPAARLAAFEDDASAAVSALSRVSMIEASSMALLGAEKCKVPTGAADKQMLAEQSLPLPSAAPAADYFTPVLRSHAAFIKEVQGRRGERHPAAVKAPLDFDDALLDAASRAPPGHQPHIRWIADEIPCRSAQHRRSNALQEASLLAHALMVARRMAEAPHPGLPLSLRNGAERLSHHLQPSGGRPSDEADGGDWRRRVAGGEQTAGAAQWAMLRPTCVVDVGGGNGILTHIVGTALGVEHICVDKHTPGLRVDMPGGAAEGDPFFRRVPKRIEELDWAADIRHDPRRTLVITKHLCGSAFDHLLRTLTEQGALPGGIAASTCCHHKCSYAAYVDRRYLRETLMITPDFATDPRLLASLRQEHRRGGGGSAFPKKPGASPPQLRRCRDDGVGEMIDDDDDWAAAAGGAGGPLASLAFDAVASRASWLQAERQPWMQRLAAAIEAALDYGRVRWLRERGYAAEAVPFVHPFVTPRNTCIVAWPAAQITAGPRRSTCVSEFSPAQ